MTDAGRRTRRARRAATDDITEEAADLASEVSEAQRPEDRRRLTERFAAAALAGARRTGRGMRTARRGVGAGTGWLTGQVMAMAPRLRVRDQAALRAQFPGMQTEDIADALIERAARASAAVGGAVGAWAALPVVPAFPAEVATETLALIGIEIKLVAELHEAYGMPATGNAADRATAYVASWAHRRGVFMVPGGLVLAAGSPLARRLRWRLATRAGRTVFSLGPLFTGAVAGAMINRHETRKLGQDIRADLRSRARVEGPGPVSLPASEPDGT